MSNWFKRLISKWTAEESVEEIPAPSALVVPHFHVDRVISPEVELPDLESMTKLQIDIWARNELEINLDRRRTKDRMIKEIHNHLNKEN